MQTWIFQGNPDQFDLDTYLGTSPTQLPWLVTRYAQQIAVGDRVFIWRTQGSAKAVAGVVAEATVVAPTMPRPESADAVPFWRENAEEAVEERFLPQHLFNHDHTALRVEAAVDIGEQSVTTQWPDELQCQDEHRERGVLDFYALVEISTAQLHLPVHAVLAQLAAAAVEHLGRVVDTNEADAGIEAAMQIDERGPGRAAEIVDSTPGRREIPCHLCDHSLDLDIEGDGPGHHIVEDRGNGLVEFEVANRRARVPVHFVRFELRCHDPPRVHTLTNPPDRE